MRFPSLVYLLGRHPEEAYLWYDADYGIKEHYLPRVSHYCGTSCTSNKVPLVAVSKQTSCCAQVKIEVRRTKSVNIEYQSQAMCSTLAIRFTSPNETGRKERRKSTLELGMETHEEETDTKKIIAGLYNFHGGSGFSFQCAD